MSRVAPMRFTDMLPLAWGALRRNRLRSMLTIGAIAFGVAVLVYLLTLGIGLRVLTIDSVRNSTTLLSFTVTTVNNDFFPLNDVGLSKVREIPQIAKALPRLTVAGEAAFGNKRASITIVAVDPDYFGLDERSKVVTGVPFNESDTNVMLVTTQFLRLFELDTAKTPLITFDLQADAKRYGIVEPIKDVIVRGIVADTSAAAVYVPRQYFETLLKQEGRPNYEHIKVLVKTIADIEPASSAVISKGYKVQTVVDTVDDINTVFSYIQWTLGVLGAIAIIVASIGMFNTLTVSLLERTREIGIMKALGVRQSDVRRLFLTEALLIGILGGAVGIGLAFAFQYLTILTFQVLALIAEGIVPKLFVNDWYLLASAMGFSVLIASITGIYPANRAAKLNPIQAIRHE